MPGGFRISMTARLTPPLDRRSFVASKESERARPCPWAFLPLPARVRRRAAIVDPFLSCGSRAVKKNFFFSNRRKMDATSQVKSGNGSNVSRERRNA